jgi:hypothetical protein
MHSNRLVHVSFETVLWFFRLSGALLIALFGTQACRCGLIYSLIGNLVSARRR